MSVYDAVAPSFERHRALPEAAAQAVRAAVIGASARPHPRLIDLGAGGGRTGWPFVAANDDYVGVDLSYGMLQAFRGRPGLEPAPALVQADGRALPFASASFDAALLVQLFGGLDDWRALIAETWRVLRPDGTLMLGRTLMDENGVDGRMKRRLTALLAEHGVAKRRNHREEVERHLGAEAVAAERLVAAQWTTTRSPRAVIERQAASARFASEPAALREQVLARLAQWAAAEFGGLDASFTETRRFELQLYKLAE